MELKNKTILIISNESWGDIWYSKHHWAYELSKNNKVYFVNPPLKWEFTNIFKIKISIFNYSDTLKILNYHNILPLTRFSVFFKINELIIFKLLNNFFKNRNNLIFWSFDPYRLITPQKMDLLTSIYFIADKYQISREKILINNVENILSVSNELTKNIKNKPVLNISHGVSKIYSDNNIKTNSAILIGTLTDRIDYVLLLELVKQIPETKFYLFGNKNIQEEENLIVFKKIVEINNVDYLGAQKYSDIEPYMEKAKLGIALYKTDRINNQINSLKIIQYLSYGLYVVSTPFDSYKKAMKDGVLFLTSDKEKYIQKCKQILISESDKNKFNKRINFAEQFLYKNLIKKVENFI